MLHNSIVSFGTAILLGLALGYILQRGRFCLNSAFRDIIFIQDMTLFRAYLFALVVAIIGSNFLEDMGWLQVINTDTGALETTTLLRQSFVPIANVLGGFLFGIGIVLAGGCASGIVYRIGEGQLSALIAILGFFFGAVMTADGLLSPINNYLKGFKVEINGTTSPAIWDLFGGGPTLKWLTIAIFAVGVLTFVFAGKPEFKSRSKGFAWGTTGLLIGLSDRYRLVGVVLFRRRSARHGGQRPDQGILQRSSDQEHAFELPRIQLPRHIPRLLGHVLHSFGAVRRIDQRAQPEGIQVEDSAGNRISDGVLRQHPDGDRRSHRRRLQSRPRQLPACPRWPFRASRPSFPSSSATGPWCISS